MRQKQYTDIVVLKDKILVFRGKFKTNNDLVDYFKQLRGVKLHYAQNHADIFVFVQV